MAWGTFTCRRHVAADDSLWDAVQHRMGELLPHALNMIQWVQDQFEELPFDNDPQEIIQSALEGIVPPDHIFGTRFRYNEATGEVDSIIRASAGWGKITVLEELRAGLGISHDQIIYMGDGSSDLPVMMHTTALQTTADYRIRAGFTIRF